MTASQRPQRRMANLLTPSYENHQNPYPSGAAPQPGSGFGLYSPLSAGTPINFQSFSSTPSLVYESSPTFSLPSSSSPLTQIPSSSSSIPVQVPLPETQDEDYGDRVGGDDADAKRRTKIMGVVLEETMPMPWEIESTTGRRKCPYHSLQRCVVWGNERI